MKRTSLFVAATLALHAALAVALLSGFLEKTATRPASATPTAVALLPPAIQSNPKTTPPLSAGKPPAVTPAAPAAQSQHKHSKATAARPAKTKAKSPQTQTPSAPTHETRENPIVQSPADSQHDKGVAPSSTIARGAPARTPVSIPAAYAATNRMPVYPRLSRANDEQGTVLLSILVQADGKAGEVRLQTSSGYPLLDEAALVAVRTWRFAPATLDGKPIAEWYQLPIPFKLLDD